MINGNMSIDDKIINTTITSKMEYRPEIDEILHVNVYDNRAHAVH